MVIIVLVLSLAPAGVVVAYVKARRELAKARERVAWADLRCYVSTLRACYAEQAAYEAESTLTEFMALVMTESCDRK